MKTFPKFFKAALSPPNFLSLNPNYWRGQKGPFCQHWGATPLPPNGASLPLQEEKTSESSYTGHFGPPRAKRDCVNSIKTNKSWCAWCTEKGRLHDHSTANCFMLRDANAHDQWMFINKRKKIPLFHPRRTTLSSVSRKNGPFNCQKILIVLPP